MTQLDRVFISIQFFIVVCFLGYTSINLSHQHKELEKKIDIILETNVGNIMSTCTYIDKNGFMVTKMRVDVTPKIQQLPALAAPTNFSRSTHTPGQ